MHAPDQLFRENAQQAESFLKAIANGHRLMILCELKDRELCVGELQEILGASQSTLSQHLARLREDELVKTRRDAQTIYYSLSNPNVTRIINLLYDIFCSKNCPSTNQESRNKKNKYLPVKNRRLAS